MTLHDVNADSFLGPRFAGRRYLRVADLIELGIVDNRSTLDHWIDAGLFPAPLRMGRRVLLFAVTEIVAVLVARAAAREQRVVEQPPAPPA